MFWRILIVVLLLTLWAGVVCAGVSGKIVSSRDNILASGPFSGNLVLTFDDTIELERFPSITYGGISVTIEDPEGGVTKVNQISIFGGNFGNYGALEKIEYPAGQYIIPFFLLKLHDDNFLFEKEGKYRISFEFRKELKGLVLDSYLNVSKCNECGMEEYLDLFYRGEYVTPYDLGIKLTEFSESLKDYRQMADLVRVYCHLVGYVTYLLTTDQDKLLANEDLVSLSGKVKEGYLLSQKLGVNTEVWRYLYLKINTIVEGGNWIDDHGKKLFGAHIINAR